MTVVALFALKQTAVYLTHAFYYCILLYNSFFTLDIDNQLTFLMVV